MKASQLFLIPAIAAALAFTGCASHKPAAGAGASALGANGASTNGLNGNGDLNSSAMGDAAHRGGLFKRVVHFDYDKSDLSAQDQATLSAHANYLSHNNTAKVTLTGHTDERGTREYNMALGERRAKSVKAYLVTNGARNDQVDTVSYGKEKPVDEGHNEAAWAENRRVEINYDANGPR